MKFLCYNIFNVERKDSLVETALSLDIYIGDDI